MHRVRPSRSNSVYHLSLLWASCGTFHPPLWLPRYSGSKLHTKLVFYFLFFIRQFMFISLTVMYGICWFISFDADRGSWSIAMILTLNRLSWMKSCNLYVFWHKINMGTMLFRYSVFRLNLVPSYLCDSNEVLII